MTLTIAPNENTQPDFTVFYTAPDGRKLTVGRIFYASAGTAKERPWFGRWNFTSATSAQHHSRDIARISKPRRLLGNVAGIRRCTDQLATCTSAIVNLRQGVRGTC
jgi:hypothetical protein